MTAAARYLLVSIRAALVLAWSATAAAVTLASKQAGADLALALDPTLTILTVVISTLAGATALAIRINNLLMAPEGEDGAPAPKFVRPWLFAAAHMSGSWMAGTAGFLLGRINDWNVWYSLFAVLLLSFLGSKGLEILAERYLSVVPLLGPTPAKKTPEAKP